MVFRFRKSFKVLPGVRFNLGKRGVSWSLGRPGATVNIGKKGVRSTIGARTTGGAVRASTGGQSRRKGNLIGGVISAIILVAALRACFSGGEPDRAAESVQPKVAAAEQRLAELERQKAEAQQRAETVAAFNAKLGEVAAGIKGALKAFVIMPRIKGELWLKTLGTYPQTSLKEARVNASLLLSRIRAGEDPRSEERQEKEAEKAVKAPVVPVDTYTVRKAVAAYEKAHISRLKPRSQLEARRPLEKVVTGAKPVAAQAAAGWRRISARIGTGGASATPMRQPR